MNADVRNIAAGLGVCLFGMLYFYNALDYDLGSVRRMGPAYFPLIVSALTVLVGLIILVPALFRKARHVPVVLWRPLIFILGSVAVFGLGLRQVGFVPTVFISVLLCSLADRAIRPVTSVILAAGTTLVFWAIFIVGLDLRIPTFGWA